MPVGRYPKKGNPPPVYARKHAVDLLWLLSSFGSYDQLARRSRLSAEAAASLLSEAAFVLMRPTDS